MTRLFIGFSNALYIRSREKYNWEIDDILKEVFPSTFDKHSDQNWQPRERQKQPVNNLHWKYNKDQYRPQAIYPRLYNHLMLIWHWCSNLHAWDLLKSKISQQKWIHDYFLTSK